MLTRLLTKRAGAKTSYNLLTYSSMECAAWARISNRKTSWPLRSTRTLESYYRLCCLASGLWPRRPPSAADYPQSTQMSGTTFALAAWWISILAVVSGELMTLIARENQLLAQVAGRPQDLQTAFWQIGPTLSASVFTDVVTSHSGRNTSTRNLWVESSSLEPSGLCLGNGHCGK